MGEMVVVAITKKVAITSIVAEPAEIKITDYFLEVRMVNLVFNCKELMVNVEILARIVQQVEKVSCDLVSFNLRESNDKVPIVD